MKYSIIVPVFEHWHLVPRLITCLERQSIGATCFELILVDNGSVNFSPPQGLPAWARLTTCSTPGSYAARNYGVECASGEWLIFTDADCLPDEDWLDCLDLRIREVRNESVILAGDVDVFSVECFPNAYEVFDLIKGIPQGRYVSHGYAVTANLAVPAKLMTRLGGFDGRVFSGGDVDLCQRAVRSGASLEFVKAARVRHPARSSKVEVFAKARRIKGGQLRSSSLQVRAISALRAFAPPVIALFRICSASGFSIRRKSQAVAVQLQLWWIEISEVYHWLARHTAERR